MIRVPCLLGPGWPGRIPADGRPRLPRAVSHSWTVKQQSVDLLAEGLWEELLDVEQPNITVMDWYVPLHHRPAQPGRTQALPEAPASRHPPRDPPAAAGPSPAHLCGPFSLSPFLQCASPEAVPSSSDVATLFS